MKNKTALLNALLVLGLTVRLIFPFVLQTDPFKGDAQESLRYARNLYYHGVYSGSIETPPETPDYHKLPGTPLLIYVSLALGIEKSSLVILPNLILSLFLFYMIWLWTREIRIRDEIKVALLGGAALIPVISYYSVQFYPDLPAATFLFGAFFFLRNECSVRNILISSALFGLSTLFRAEFWMFLPFIIGWIYFSAGFAGAGKLIPAYVVMIILLHLPWNIWTLREFGKPKPLARNFFIENEYAPESEECASGLYDWINTWHTKESHVKKAAWKFSGIRNFDLPDEAFRNEEEREKIYRISEGVYTCREDSHLSAIATERRKEAPLHRWLILPAQRLFHLLIRTERFDEVPAQSVWLNAGWYLFAFFSSLINAAAVIAWLFWRKLNPLCRIMLLSASIRLLFFALFYHVEYRYMMVMFPEFLIISMYIADNLVSKIKNDTQRSTKPG